MDGERRRRLCRLLMVPRADAVRSGSMFVAVAWGACMQNFVLNFDTYTNPSATLAES